MVMMQGAGERQRMRNELCRLPDFKSVSCTQGGWHVEYTVLMDEPRPSVCRHLATFSPTFDLLSTVQLDDSLVARFPHPDSDLTISFHLHRPANCDDGDIKEVLWVQITKGTRLVHTAKCPHGPSLYLSPHFASPYGYSSDRKFVYVAEKGVIEQDGDSAYLCRPTFGEAFDDKVEPVLCILDLESKQIKVIEMEDHYPMKPSFLNSHTLVLAGYAKTAPKVGVSYCFNRPTQILLYDLTTGRVRVISEATESCRSPIVISDLVYYLRHPLWKSHFDASEVVKYSSDGREEVICSGHFEELLASHVHARELTLNPIRGAHQQLDKGPSDDVNYELLAVYGECKFYVKSTAGTFRKLMVILKNGQERTLIDNNLCLEPCKLESGSCKIDGVDVVALKRPGNQKAIVAPHGGPNSAALDEFIWTNSYLVNAGFDVLKVNYTGSAGSTSIRELIIGHQEIEDTRRVAQALKPLYQRLFVMGGSHGGFTACTLIGRWPDLFDAAVVINPVTDLRSMQLASDIPDWPYGQQQLTCPFTAKGIYALDESTSPLRWADDVRVPVLVLLGQRDRRVPPFQGLAWSRFLRSVRVHMFPKANHSLSEDPESALQVPLLIADFLSAI
jgi:pimeloyl-ACP methyl ester carboxylesterase